MNKKLLNTSLLVLGSLCSSTAMADLSHDFGTNGYFRIGTGASDNGATQEVFKAPGAGSKYRLGNENDTWIELDAHDIVTVDDSGPYIRTEIMAILNGEQNNKIEFDEIIQLYAEAGNFTTLFGDPKIWIGRRYYDRHDIHINDFFFLNTLQGFDGGGIRDMDLDFAKLALAFGRKEAENDIYQSRFDARLSDIKTNKNGSITLWSAYDSSGSRNAYKSLDGYTVGVMHIQEDFLGGSNKFMLQYGEGLGRHAGKGGIDDAAGTVSTSEDVHNFNDAQTFRVVNANLVEPNENWAMMTAMVYERLDSKRFDGTDQEWFSLGFRPVWFVNKHFRIPLELGYDYVDNRTTNSDGSLFKVTLALPITHI